MSKDKTPIIWLKRWQRSPVKPTTFDHTPVQLLPDIGKFIENQSALLEVRGFISIESSDDESGSIFLNPEIRGTFIPNDFATSDNPDFDQLSYSLGLSKVTV